MPHTYEKDGAAIYAESFATIRNEADLARFSEIEELVVVRMIPAFLKNAIKLQDFINLSALTLIRSTDPGPKPIP